MIILLLSLHLVANGDDAPEPALRLPRAGPVGGEMAHMKHEHTKARTLGRSVLDDLLQAQLFALLEAPQENGPHLLLSTETLKLQERERENHT